MGRGSEVSRGAASRSRTGRGPGMADSRLPLGAMKRRAPGVDTRGSAYALFGSLVTANRGRPEHAKGV
jgi:hypothetical protein